MEIVATHTNVIVPGVLRGGNYKMWSIFMRHYLLGQDLWDVVQSSQSPAGGNMKREWIKKNALALHAIKISCGEEIFHQIKEKDSAKDVWDALVEMHKPPVVHQEIVNYTLERRTGPGNLASSQYETLTNAISNGELRQVKKFFRENSNPRSEIIFEENGYTALHFAVYNRRSEIVDYLIKFKLSKEDLVKKDYSGSTALSIAARYGVGKSIAQKLVGKNYNLLTIEDNNGKIPVELACTTMQEDLTRYLYRETPLASLNENNGARILQECITIKMFDIVCDLLCHFPDLASRKCSSDSIPLILTLAQTPPPFFGGSNLSFWERKIYDCMILEAYVIKEDKHRSCAEKMQDFFQTCGEMIRHCFEFCGGRFQQEIQDKQELAQAWSRPIQETNQDTNQETNQETNQDTNQDTNEETNQDTNQDANEEINEDTNQDTNQDTNEETNQDTNQEHQELSFKKKCVTVLWGLVFMSCLPVLYILASPVISVVVVLYSVFVVAAISFFVAIPIGLVVEISLAVPLILVGLIIGALRRLVSILLWCFGTDLYKTKLMDAYARKVIRLICQPLSKSDQNQSVQSTAEEATINGIPDQNQSVQSTAGEATIQSIAEDATIQAIKNGIPDIVKEIRKVNANILWSSTGPEDSRSRIQEIFALAVKHRQEEVAHLLYESEMEKNMLFTTDEDGNNTLHLAAKLAPHYQLGCISGAVLQMQSELRWFEAVKEIVPRPYREAKNKDSETPLEMFVREHKDLLKEAEEWAKKTAESSTVVGALIITIMFAATFTVPGGNDQSTGFPIFLHKSPIPFMVFIVSDAISLFAASSSVLMFLGILTSRYSNEDFFKSLPIKLTIGLSSLIISIATMTTAFCASLFIILQGRLGVLIPITSLFGIPVTLFALLQFPLLVEILCLTFSPNNFVKKGTSWRSRMAKKKVALAKWMILRHEMSDDASDLAT